MSIIELIQLDFPFTTRELGSLIVTAPNRYKLHEIEKRNGRGKRVIAQPTAEVKVLQRWVISQFFGSLPIHDAAIAYRKGLSIKDHARVHAGNRYLLKMDFKDFFPSIYASDFIYHAKKYLNLSEQDLTALTYILFRHDRDSDQLILSIGAPSSPVVSNTLLYEFDTKLTEFCARNGVVYSRYADDLAFSTSLPKVLDDVHKFIKKLCESLTSPRLRINQDKTVFTSKKKKRQLTGLVLSNEGTVSLGRNKKREIRAMAHKYSQGKLDVDQVNKLRGLLAYAYSIDPEYLDSISNMIGLDMLNALKHSTAVKQSS